MQHAARKHPAAPQPRLQHHGLERLHVPYLFIFFSIFFLFCDLFNLPSFHFAIFSFCRLFVLCVSSCMTHISTFSSYHGSVYIVYMTQVSSSIHIPYTIVNHNVKTGIVDLNREHANIIYYLLIYTCCALPCWQALAGHQTPEGTS